MSQGGAAAAALRAVADAPASAPRRARQSLPWTDACAPSSVADLVVHLKKVDAVRAWLAAARAPRAPRLLLADGPPGCGKAATVAAVAAEAGMSVLEWTPPLQATWEESAYVARGGPRDACAPRHESKLDAFLSFVVGTRLKGLALTPTTQGGGGGGAAGRVVLIRDLPHARDAAARAALASALADLCRYAASPVALLVTSGGGRGGADKRGGPGADAAAGAGGGLHKEIVDAAVAAGATRLSFNPLTEPNITRALLAAAARTGAALGGARAAALAAAAGGDLRSALLAAHLATAGEAPAPPPRAPARKRQTRAQAAAAAPDASRGDAGAAARAAAFAARDAGLDALHALGRILHNKRDWSGSGGSGVGGRGADASTPSSTHPLPTVDADAALAASGLDASTAATWLFDNLPLFISGEPALPDAAAAAHYLAAADILAQPRHGSLAEAVAAAVAGRGVLWARARPAPTGWLSLRGPIGFQAARATASNAARMREALPLAGAGAAAADTLPAVRALAAAAPGAYGHLLPAAWARLWEGRVVEGRPRPAGVVLPAAAEVGGAADDISDGD